MGMSYRVGEVCVEVCSMKPGPVTDLETNYVFIYILTGNFPRSKSTSGNKRTRDIRVHLKSRKSRIMSKVKKRHKWTNKSLGILVRVKFVLFLCCP